MIILPVQIREIANRVARGERLLKVISSFNISPLVFFDHLDNVPEDKLLFERARQSAVEMFLDESMDLLNAVNDRMDLEKAKAQIAFRSWLAEKLIPHTYGTKVDINVNHTVDIKSVLAEANKRVQIANTVLETKMITEDIGDIRDIDPESLIE